MLAYATVSLPEFGFIIWVCHASSLCQRFIVPIDSSIDFRVCGTMGRLEGPSNSSFYYKIAIPTSVSWCYFVARL